MPALKQSDVFTTGKKKHRAVSSGIADKLKQPKTNTLPAGLQNHAHQQRPIIQRKPGEDEELPVQRMLMGTQNSSLHAFRPAQSNHTHAESGKQPFSQTKLSINAPGDQYEQDADAMAYKVMRMKDPVLPQQRDQTISIQRKCAACEDEEKHVHRKESSATEKQGGNELDSYLGSLSSSGYSLSENSRQFFEPRFGADFSNVRIHTDSVASKSAQSINALAYTTGNHIVFNQGQYTPDSKSAQRLMAHELTHVVQQGGVQRSIQKNNVEKTGRLDTLCNFVSKAPTGEIFHFIVNTALFVDGEENRLNNFLASLSENTEITILGVASSDGPSKLNEKLSCDRALVVAEIIRGSRKEIKKIEATGGYIGTDHNNEYRSVSVDIQSKQNEPKPVPHDPQCQPANGKMNDDCGAYTSNAWWLPFAYVNNATCACGTTPNTPKYSCIRKFLQDRLASVSTSFKSLAALQKINEFNPLTRETYDIFVQAFLTPMIYKDHVDAYKNCCCKNGPATYAAWMGVTTIPIRPCSLVGFSVEKTGNCDDNEPFF